MNIIIILILLILFLIFLIITNNDYMYGNLVGLLHRNKLTSGFNYIDMRDYSKNLDSRDFVNGYICGLG
jgi:hypothetical protein